MSSGFCFIVRRQQGKSFREDCVVDTIWPWQLIYLLLLEKVLHYARTMWRSVIILKQKISSEALSTNLDELATSL
jgi:hypothetical protein